jgi:hypothetical protein
VKTYIDTNFENENALMAYVKVSSRIAREDEGHRMRETLVKPSATY